MCMQHLETIMEMLKLQEQSQRMFMLEEARRCGSGGMAHREAQAALYAVQEVRAEVEKLHRALINGSKYRVGIDGTISVARDDNDKQSQQSSLWP